MVDDIYEAREELVKAGIEIDIEPNKGQSETWQMWIHDPDGNKFEIMQYTACITVLVKNINKNNFKTFFFITIFFYLIFLKYKEVYKTSKIK